MKTLRLAQLVLIAIILPCMTGCIIVHKHTEHKSCPPQVVEPCGDGAVYIDGESTSAEIEAVRSLDFSSERAEHLNRIARRPGINPDAQVHLVKTTFEVLDFESEKMQVLQTLIKNPTLTVQGKNCILHHLKELDFSSNRKAILDALDKHGPVVQYVEEPVVYQEEIIIEVPANQAAPEKPDTTLQD